MSGLGRLFSKQAPADVPAEIDSAAYSEVMLELGARSLEQGNLGPAALHLRSSLTAFREQGNQAGVQEALALLAALAEKEGRLTAAEHYVVQAIAVARANRDRVGLAELLLQHGHVLALRASPEALMVLEEALAIAAAIEDPRALGTAYLRLARENRRLGDPATAQGHAEAALRVFREAEQAEGEATALIELGLARRVLGQRAEAAADFREGAEIADSIADEGLAAAAADNLATTEADPAEARAAAARAAAGWDRLGERRRLAASLEYGAALAVEGGRWREAVELQERALKVLQELGDTTSEAVARGRLAALAAATGDHEGAIRERRAADGPEADTVELRLLVARAAAAAGDLARALPALELAVEAARASGDGAAIAATVNERALVLAQQDPARARADLCEALAAALSSGQPQLGWAIAANLARVGAPDSQAATEVALLEKLLEVERKPAGPGFELLALLQVAELRLLLGELGPARLALVRAADRLEGAPTETQLRYLGARARLERRLGALEAAVRSVAEAAAIDSAVPAPLDRRALAEATLGPLPELDDEALERFWEGRRSSSQM